LRYLPLHRHNIRLSGSKRETESKEKTETFATHLSKAFKPNSRKIILEEENRLFSDAIIAAILDISTKSFTVKKVKAIIKNLDLKKASRYELITNQILQKLPEIGIKFITQLYNIICSLQTRFFSTLMEDSVNYYDSEI